MANSPLFVLRGDTVVLEANQEVAHPIPPMGKVERLIWAYARCHGPRETKQVAGDLSLGKRDVLAVVLASRFLCFNDAGLVDRVCK